jgi:hypothetical protein
MMESLPCDRIDGQLLSNAEGEKVNKNNKSLLHDLLFISTTWHW